MKNEEVNDGDEHRAEMIMDSRVPSLKSGLTWGTADETVLMNNKARVLSRPVGFDSALYRDDQQDNSKVGQNYRGGGNMHLSQGTHGCELSASKIKNIDDNDTSKHNTSAAAIEIAHASQRNTSSLFNYIFCLGGNDDMVVFEESEETPTKFSVDTRNAQRVMNKNSHKENLLWTETTNKNMSKESDAYILERALQESRNQGTPRRKHKNQDSLYVAPSDKLGSLDIVMELQQQEKESGRNDNSNIAGKSPRSPRKSRVTRATNDNHTTIAAMDEQSVMTDIFDFGDDTFGGAHPSSKPSSKGLWIQGPANGTFLNISTEANAIHPEVANTYVSYRCDKKSVALVISRLTCSVPLYHHKISMEREGNPMNTSISSSHSSSTDNDEGTKIQISSKIKNVCSEPASKLFDVRGPTYPSDGKKIPSDESMFALLGVDNVIKKKDDTNYREKDICKSPECYVGRLRAASERLGLIAPFLLVVNFVVPWGNLIGYFYRPDGEHGRPYNTSRKGVKSEKLWDQFIAGDAMYRNRVLKFIPHVVEGPWALKKLVGTQPAMIGHKIPTSYFGSLNDGYLEICIDITKGGKMANNICSAVASKASLVSIDLAFLLQGDSTQNLPEQILSVMRLHHLRLKKS